jgi:phage terminase Nu1 subunit (DNA packaging protein)
MADLTVNKRELAKILECSLPTLDKLIDRYADLPIEARGSNGVEWQFDPAKVVAFLKAKDAEEAHAADERRSLFEQFKLPIDEVAAAGEDAGLSPAQRAQMALARSREHELALKVGMVVPRSDSRQAFDQVIRGLGRFLDTLPTTLQRFHNLPDAVVRSIRAQIDEQRRLFVAEFRGELLAEAERRDGTTG